MKFSVVEEGKIYRGSRPESADDFNLLIKQKVGFILNLERGWFEFIHGITNKEFCTSVMMGIVPFHMTLSDVRPPSNTETDICLKILEHGKMSPDPLFVHCLSGVDRTGYICAAYRVLCQDWPVDQAIQEWKDMGRHWWYWWWEKSLRNYIAARKS